MARSESLICFEDAHAVEVARWPASMDEVRRWAGASTGFPVSASVFGRWHADPDVHPYVLCEGERPVAYGEVWTDEEEQETELARLIVKPSDRGRGLGKRLTGLLLARAARFGYPEAFVRVVPDNRVAISCYRSAGFSPIPDHEREEFNRGQPVDYVWMRHPMDVPPPPS